MQLTTRLEKSYMVMAILNQINIDSKRVAGYPRRVCLFILLGTAQEKKTIHLCAQTVRP